MPQARADEIQGTPKAIVGGAFLGAEVVAIPMAHRRREAPVGRMRCSRRSARSAAASAATSWSKAYDDVEDGAYGSAFMLAGGLALIIPTIVAHAQRDALPPERRGDRRSRADERRPRGEPGQHRRQRRRPVDPAAARRPRRLPPTGRRPALARKQRRRRKSAPRTSPLSLVDVHEGSLRMGIPVARKFTTRTRRARLNELGRARTSDRASRAGVQARVLKVVLRTYHQAVVRSW